MSNIQAGIEIKAGVSGIENIKKLSAEIEAVGEDTSKLSQQTEQLADKFAQTRELESGLSHLKPSLQDIQSEIQGLVSRAGGLAYVAKEAMQFETAMAGVKKVADGTPEQYAALSDELMKMGAQLGISADKMATLAAAGGQLGIPMENLTEFTRIASNMATAFGMSADQAGEAAATIANVFQLPMAEVEKLGDAINVLGNNTAAKEKDIVEAMARIGGNAKQFGLAANEAAALADAFIALGKPPEVAATAINALLSKLQTSQSQSKDFKEALEAIGTSADEMAAQINANPQQALSGFLHKLQSLDKQSRSLVLADLFGAEYSDDIALLVGSLGEYEKALKLVNDQGKVTGAMQKEVGNAMSTTEAQINKAKVNFENAAITIGNSLLPAISLVANGIAGAAGAVGEIATAFPVLTQLAALFAAGRVAVTAYEAAVRLSGGAVSAAFLTQKVGIDATRASITAAGLAAKDLGSELKTAASSGDYAGVSSSIRNLSGLLKSAATNAGLLFSAFEVGKGIGSMLYEQTDLFRILGDNMAKVLGMADSLWETGSLEKYNQHFRTSFQMEQELEKSRKQSAQNQKTRAEQNIAAIQKEVAATAQLQTASSNAAQSSVNDSHAVRSSLEQLNKTAQTGAAAVKNTYKELAASLKNASNAADLSRVQTAAKMAMENGSISAKQYEQVIEQAKQRTEELANKTPKIGASASESYGQASAAAATYASVVRSASGEYGNLESAVKTASDTSGLTDLSNKARDAYESGAISGSKYEEVVEGITERTNELRSATRSVALSTDDYSLALKNVATRYRDVILSATTGMNADNLKIINGKATSDMQEAMAQFKKDTDAAKEAIERLNQAVSDGTINLDDLAYATARSSSKVGELDKTTLKNLNAAIDAAKQKMEELRQEAADTTAQMQAQLAELNGDTEATYAYQNQKKLAELQAKLTEAQKNRQGELVAQYSKQIELQQQIYSKQKAQRQQEAANNQSSSNTAQANTASSSQANGNAAMLAAISADGINRLNVDTQALQEALAARDQKIADAAANSIISQLQNAIKRST